MKLKDSFFTLAVLAILTTAQAQVKVGANPGTINGGSALEIEASDKGLLMPRVALTTTTTWGLAGTAVAGMSVYNTSAGLTSSNTAYPAMGVGEYYWDGTGWVSKKSSAQLGADNGLTVGYNSTGNVGLGGTLSKNTDVATDGKSMSFSGTGSFGLGTASPQRRLHLVNNNGGDYSDDILVQTYSANSTPGIFFHSAGGTVASPTNIVASRLLGTVGSSGQVGGNETALSAIKFFYEGDGTTNLSSMKFFTNNTTRMTLNENGNLGIGTASPGARLEVNNGSTAGAIKIVDGTQGAGKTLISDANGVGTWQTPASFKAVVLGTVNQGNKSVASNTLIGSSVTLSQGKWLVYVGQLVLTSEAATAAKNLWVRISLSSSNTANSSSGFTFLGSSLASGWLSPSLVTNEGGYSMITGVIPVQVTSSSLTLYTWFTNIGATSTSMTATIGNSGENYFFAIPVN